jgi:DNA modification methylase
LIDVNKIYNMDCLEGLKLLDDNSIDSIVTDPPYGLSKEPNIVEVLTHWLNDKEYKHPSKGFMGKEWDSFVPSPTIWKEVLRVLKPGGHLLCFAGTRTYDLMCMSIRLAGFEIRDQIQWIYGSGFPKSHDISKAIDKKAGAEREVICDNPNARPNSQPKYSLDGENKNFQIKVQPITAPSTLEAQQWDGWGTALKPANEPIVVARKPISEKTIAENVLKWGTGGINIDDCRVGNEELTYSPKRIRSGQGNYVGDNYKPNNPDVTVQGRFPANIILDEEAGRMLDEQSGITKSGKVKTDKEAYEGTSNTGFLRGKSTSQNQYGDTGGASRFFYCAKASKKERGEGNNHPTVKPLSLIKYLITLVTPPNGICLDPFEGSGTHALACKELGFDYIGFELDNTYYNLANKRIEEHIKSKNMIK